MLDIKLICIVQARLTKVVFCGGSSLYGEDLYGEERSTQYEGAGNAGSPKPKRGYVSEL